MGRLHANFLAGELSDPVSGLDAVIDSAGFAGLPVISSPDYMFVTLDPLAQFGQPEIVKVTDHASGATTAVTERGQRGTTRRTHGENTKWRHGAIDDDFGEEVFVPEAFTGAAIQDAVNAAAAIGGGKVRCRPGVYIVTESIVVPSFVHLLGAGTDQLPYYPGTGGGTVLITAADDDLAGVPMVDISGSTRVRVAWLDLQTTDTNGSTTTAYGIADLSGGYGCNTIEHNSLTGFKHSIWTVGNVCRITHNMVRRSYDNSITLAGGSSDNFVAFNDCGGQAQGGVVGVGDQFGVGIDIDDGLNNTILGNQLFNQRYGIRANSGDNRIEANRCEKHDYAGIRLELNARGSIVVGNHCFNNGYKNTTGEQAGISVQSCVRMLITGNYCDNNTGAPGADQQQFGILLNNSTHNNVVGNHFARSMQNGVRVKSSNYNNIQANLVIGSRQHGIKGTDSSDCAYNGNMVSQSSQEADNTYDQMSFDANCARLTVNGNIIKHESLTNKARYAINHAAPNTSFFVGNDTTNGGTTGAYSWSTGADIALGSAGKMTAGAIALGGLDLSTRHARFGMVPEVAPGAGGSATVVLGMLLEQPSTNPNFTSAHTGGVAMQWLRSITVTADAASTPTDFITSLIDGPVAGTNMSPARPGAQLVRTGADGNYGRTVRANSGTQTGDLDRWEDSSAAVLSRVNKAGFFMTRKTAAPADADLANSELAVWLDATPGATLAMFKAKDSAGTVRTGSVVLS